MVICNVGLPHPYLPIINPLIHLGSRGWLQRLRWFSFQARIFTSNFLYLSFFFPYIKMYSLKCRRVTETENITCKNARLMRRGQCIISGKTKTQFIKRNATDGSFLNTWVNKLHFKCICQVITLHAREQNSIKDWIRVKRKRSGAYHKYCWQWSLS